jgi:putative endonuclease
LNNRAQGTEGENAAALYLEKNGYRILERNFRYDRAEVDIIAKDGDQLVFVEVKSRRSNVFGDPEDAITEAKCRQLWKAAEGYLDEHDLIDQNCRFDVIAIEYVKSVPAIRHTQDAF